MEAEASRKVMRVKPDLEDPPASLDLISDEMLHIIISHVPTKYAMRTSILSKPWHHLWCSIPLDLTVDCNVPN
jgi:hypothetical protein